MHQHARQIDETFTKAGADLPSDLPSDVPGVLSAACWTSPRGLYQLPPLGPSGWEYGGGSSTWRDARFVAFCRLLLAPLKHAQQQRMLEQWLGGERAATLLHSVRDVIPRDGTGHKLTSNALRLSMIASVYELRQGVGMPMA